MKWQASIVFIYALLVLVGGLMGFLKAHSHMSLIMGSTTGILLIIAAIGIYNTHSWGLITAFAVTAILMFFFGYRFYTTQAFMPAGLMTALSVTTLLLLSFLSKK